METKEQASSLRGWVGSVRKFPALVLNILQNRLELLSLEIKEEKFRLTHLLLWLALAVVLGSMALLMITLTVVLLSPEPARPWVLAGACLVYVLLTLWAGLQVRRQLRERPPPLESTVEQLKKDVEWIRSRT